MMHDGERDVFDCILSEDYVHTALRPDTPRAHMTQSKRLAGDETDEMDTGWMDGWGVEHIA